METASNELPERPGAVTTAAAMLLGNALVLTLFWALGVDEVGSNGARVFFVVLWSYLAWSVYRGGGWVRTAIVAIFAITIWGAFNTPSFMASVRTAEAGETATNALALFALAAMWSPPARRWFAAARELRSRADG